MPAPWSAELHGLIEAQREATRIATELSGAPIVQATRDATLLVTRTSRQFAKVDTGRWRASITPEVRVMGQQVVGVVGSNLAYAPFAHEDTRPHWPPIAALVPWARRHHVSAYVIARAISRRGTKGDQAIYRGLQENLTNIVALYERAVGKIVRS
jgi:hypothetical protein